MKSWLGFFGVVILLAIICGVFAFIVPLESDIQTDSSTLCTGSNLMPGDNISSCPEPVTKDYHLVKGEMQAYQDAKKCIDAHSVTCPATTVKLFL